jgi:predicted AAA+ superfamily ATPase
LPERLNYQENDKIFQYIDSVYNDILVHDILERRSIMNITNFNNFSNFMMSNSSKRISLTKIENLINSTYGVKIDKVTICNYIMNLQEALLIKKIDYVNNNTMMILQNLCRYYAADIGIKNSFSEKNIYATGQTIENIVYLELIKRGYKVNGISFYDTSPNRDQSISTSKEIDFVCSKNTKHFNIQVTTNLVPENYSSEIGNFNYLKNDYENILLSLDENLAPIKNVKTINIID